MCVTMWAEDNVQCKWQELLVSKLSRKCVMGASLIDKQYASRYKLANTCNVQSDDMQAQNVPQFPIQWVHCSQGLPEGATPGYKQRLHVMSWTVPPCSSKRKVVWDWTPFVLFVSFVFNNRSIWLYYTLSECQSGGVIAQLLKPTFWFPPPFFQNIFFLDLVPPSKKLQMQTQIQRLFSDDKRRQKRWLAYFSSRDDYKSYTLLTLCWHLADNCTSVTPCWPFVDTLLTIVQV